MQRAGTVDKCFDIIEVILSSTEEGMGIREMSRLLDINPTTVHNLCWTLCARGYLRQDPASRRFKLAARFLPFAQSNQVWQCLTESVEPIVERCREELNESILLTVMDHTEIWTLIYLPAEQALRSLVPRTLGGIAYRTAAGKVLLSGLTEVRLHEYFAQFPPEQFCEGTNSGPDTMLRELQSVRQQGYATSCDELAEGMSAVAIPILGPTGELIAALGSGARTDCMDSTQTKLMLNSLLAYGEQISAAWFYNLVPKLPA